MGLQRVGHDLVTKQQQQNPCKHLLKIFFNVSFVKSAVLGSLGKTKMSEPASSSPGSSSIRGVVSSRTGQRLTERIKNLI